MQHAAAQIVDQLAQRQSDRALVDARLLHMTADAVQASATVARQAAVLGPDLATQAHDVRDRGDRLHIVDDGRGTERTLHCGKRRFQAGLTAPAFERVQQGGLFAADIGTRPDMDVDVNWMRDTERLLANKPALERFIDRGLEATHGRHELTADVDITDVCPNRAHGHGTALDQAMRVQLHDRAVFERARLTLVGIDDEIRRHLAVFG
jgi:hypothetical protein